MKHFKFLSVLIFITTTVYSQKTEIRHETSMLGGGSNPVSVVDIEKANLKTVEKSWTSYLKNHKGKLSESNDVFFLDNAKIKEISDDTLDIYSTVVNTGNGVRVTMAVNKNGTFINNSEKTHGGVDQFLYEFAVSVKKDMAKNELAIAKKALSAQGKNYDKLESSNKKLEKSISSMKNKIADNEREIKKNNEELGKHKHEIDAQKDLLKELERKIKNIE